MRGSRLALSLAAAALLLLVVLVARGGSAVPSQLAEPTVEPGLRAAPPAPAQSGRTGPSLQYSLNDPELFAKVVIAIAVSLVLLAIALATLNWLRNRIRNIGGAGDVVDRLEGTVDTVMRLRLRDAVEQARDTLARPGGEHPDAIIRAWVTLENATDHKRAPHQTATEFTVALLEKETADEDALRELRTLYHRARFGRQSGEGDADRARTALDRILATIR